MHSVTVTPFAAFSRPEISEAAETRLERPLSSCFDPFACSAIGRRSDSA